MTKQKPTSIKLDFDAPTAQLKDNIDILAGYIQTKIKKGEEVHLNFICTHNSRRSQLAQVWARVAALHFGMDVKCFSGGVEVTEFNPRAVDALKRAGFRIERLGAENPLYLVYPNEVDPPLRLFSKLYDDKENPTKGFAAVMTCSSADEACPFIPGTDLRIPLRYDDPKEADDTPEQDARYDERSRQIASDMFYLFGEVKKGL